MPQLTGQTGQEGSKAAGGALEPHGDDPQKEQARELATHH